MQYVEGEELSTLVRSGGLGLSELLDLAVPLVDAVSAAHRGGIVHRDLKPSNVMIDKTGRVRVLDFGLAKLSGSDDAPVASTEAPTAAYPELTDAGTAIGTAAYMSPEQAEGGEVDQRSDIFSLGIMLYELATGRRPFHGDSALSLGASILRDEPTPVREVRPELPIHLGRIIGHALQKNVERRYQTAIDLRNDLEELSNEVSASDRSVSEHQTAATPRLRSQALRWGALLAAIVLLSLLALSFDVGGLRRALLGDPERDTPIVIAVLPFEFTGDEEDVRYLSDGLAQRLITNLARLDSFSVKAWGLVSRLPDQGDPISVGRSLGVEAVVAAHVEQHAERIAVAAELIDVATGAQLWGGQYNREIDDVFEVEEVLARAITENLSVSLSGEQEEHLASSATESALAFQLYHKGLAYLERPSPTDHARGIQFFERAVEEDPEFALAWALLSFGHT